MLNINAIWQHCSLSWVQAIHSHIGIERVLTATVLWPPSVLQRVPFQKAQPNRIQQVLPDSAL